MRYIIGIDEAGRGPLAGPVAVGAVKVGKGFDARRFRGARDSKQLSFAERLAWYETLKECKRDGMLDVAVCCVGADHIDSRGIVPTIRVAVRRVLKKLSVEESDCAVLLDGGLRASERFVFQTTIVRGDEAELPIMLASIAAKVVRDKKMIRLARQFPVYGFERHKGYGTAEHIERLRIHGMCALHRKTFCKNIDFLGRW